MPYGEKDVDGDMVECSGCKEWFYLSCETISPHLEKRMKSKYYQ